MTTADNTTASPVGRVPIPADAVDTLRQRLRELCQELATQIGEADDCADKADPAGQRAVTTMVAVAEAIALETVQLQRWLWDEAVRRGVSVSAVARARGVRQQTMSRWAQQR